MTLSVELEIKGTSVRLTPGELRELRDRISELLGEPTPTPPPKDDPLAPFSLPPGNPFVPYQPAREHWVEWHPTMCLLFHGTSPVSSYGFRMNLPPEENADPN